MRWGQLHFRDAVHLISRLRRQLPLIGEAMGVRKSKASPSRGGGTAIAVTERSYQICGNLSVTFGDSSPARGAFFFRCGGVKKGAAGGSPFSISYQYVRITALTLPKICASLPSIG